MHIIQHIYKLVDFLLDLLGIKFIWYKIHPPEKPSKRPPRTITLWLLSIMGALFTIASIRYELESTKLEYRISNIMMQADSNPRVLEYVPRLQNRLLPYKPSIINPISTIKSFFDYFDHRDFDTSMELKALLISKKEHLTNLDLNDGLFVIMDLSDANFRGSKLVSSNFMGSVLVETDLYLANLAFTDFQYVYMENGILSYSNLAYANFSDAMLIETNFDHSLLYHTIFTRAVLTGADMSNVVFGDNAIEFTGAIYNSECISSDVLFNSIKKNHVFCVETIFSIPNCIKKTISKYIPPTKFPPGFDPEAHGMIDISRIK